MNTSHLLTFDFSEKPVRIILKDSTPWFVVVDVCRILDHSSATMAVKGIDGDDLSNVEVTDALGRSRKTTTVNESGLYSLIFSSRKEKARNFKRWVTSEVLPSIRATGKYSMSEETEPETPIDRAVRDLESVASQGREAAKRVVDGTISTQDAHAVGTLCAQVTRAWELRMRLKPERLPDPYLKMIPDANALKILGDRVGMMPTDGKIRLVEMKDDFGEAYNATSLGHLMARYQGKWLYDSLGRKFNYQSSHIKQNGATHRAYKIHFNASIKNEKALEGEVIV